MVIEQIYTYCICFERDLGNLMEEDFYQKKDACDCEIKELPHWHCMRCGGAVENAQHWNCMVERFSR
jgi:hypothetical protein